MRKLRLMKRSVIFLLVVLGLGVSASAQTRLPGFDQYPAKVERVRAKSINFKGNPDAHRYRAVLTDALKHGVDFGGHYIIAIWGCGTACTAGGIIDARTGDVFWPRELAGIYTTFDEPIQKKSNSRLVIVSQVPATKADLREDIYFEWKNDRLRRIRSVLHKSN